jgi:hypothetical protein
LSKKRRGRKRFPGGYHIVASLRNAFHHVFNPLHVYCRLMDMGVSGTVAQRVSRVYERFVFRLLP